MKNLILISIVALLVGCVRAPVGSNNSLHIPEKVNLTADSKPIEKVASLVGQTFKVTQDKTVKEKDGTPSRKIELRSDGTEQIVKIFLIVGGLLLVVSVVAMAFLKAYSFAWSSFLSGLVIIIGTLFLKLFAVPLAWLTLIVLVLAGGYEIWKHRKSLTLKNAAKAAADLVDNGKFDRSNETKV